jgi:hypothetical protein
MVVKSQVRILVRQPVSKRSYMPQASTEDQERMIKWFGSIDDAPVIQFLKSRGYVLRPGWYWTKPTPSHNVSIEERHCMRFLIDEWDFDGYEPGPDGK